MIVQCRWSRTVCNLPSARLAIWRSSRPSCPQGQEHGMLGQMECRWVEAILTCKVMGSNADLSVYAAVAPWLASAGGAGQAL